MNLSRIEDIDNLINSKIEETLTLEYKQEIGDNKEIAKDISAFANTDGGIIVYGIKTADRIPIGKAWITDKGIEEKVQNVVSTNIQPRLENVSVNSIKNPDNNAEAVYIVDIPKSPIAPHMAKNYYYKRFGSTSSPMNDSEVKNTIFSSGRIASLRLEIKQNLALSKQTRKFLADLEAYTHYEDRTYVALIPLNTDAWNALISAGLFYSLGQKASEQLVSIYGLIHEINSIIEWFKVSEKALLHTPAEPSSSRNPVYLPAIVRNKIENLINLLQQISTQDNFLLE